MSLDTEIPFVRSKKFNVDLRDNPHIYWCLYRRCWYVVFSRHFDYTRADLDAQKFAHKLNLTKQAHPVK